MTLFPTISEEGVLIIIGYSTTMEITNDFD